MSISLKTPQRQEASAFVDAFHIRRIATELYRFDRRNTDVVLDELDQVSQEKYERDAALIARMRDLGRVRAAMYAATDEVVPGGVGSLLKRQRLAAVAVMIAAFDTFRSMLFGEQPGLESVMTKLAEADAQAPTSEDLTKDHAEAAFRSLGAGVNAETAVH